MIRDILFRISKYVKLVSDNTSRLSSSGTGSHYFTVKGSLCLLFCCIASVNTVDALKQ